MSKNYNRNLGTYDYNRNLGSYEVWVVMEVEETMGQMGKTRGNGGQARDEI